MLTALLAAALWFPPFPVGPPAPQFGATHITIWAETAEAGRARCVEELSYYPPGSADCIVQHASWAPDPNKNGWAL